MPKIPRVTAKIFAGNADVENLGQFGSALTGTKITNNDINVLQALPAFEQGWSEAVITNRNYPTLEEMNSVQRIASQQIAYTLQNGMPEWDSNTTYYTNQFCRVGKDFYCSKMDENIGNNPETAVDKWELWPRQNDGDFLSTSNLTNYILSAPNGVFSVEADGLTVSIKKGLTLLMPDGRDGDNNLKNYKHVVEEEFSYTLTNFTTTSGRFVLVLASNNTVGWGTYTDMDYIPTINRGTWIRHIYSNKIYVWNDTTQSYNENPRPLGVIGRVDITNGKILAQGQFYPSSLLKESDIPSLSNVSLPSHQIRTLVLGANGTRYTALQNGYIHLAGTSTSAQCAVELVNQTSGYHDYAPGAYASSFVTANIPVVVGDVFQANVINVTPQFFQINYACGVV